MYIPCNHEVELTHELSAVVTELAVDRTIKKELLKSEIVYRQELKAINEQYQQEVSAAMARKKPE